MTCVRLCLIHSFWFLSLILLWQASAFAQTDAFTVRGVTVDVTAENSLQARDRAFEQAQIKAFEELANRNTNVGEGFQTPDVDTIGTLIQDFEITDEKLSSVQYIATYTFRFRADAVKAFFANADFEVTDVVSRPVLALPFYQTNTQTILWSPQNIWFDAWKRANVQKGLVPVIVPIGDLSDVRDIGDEQALSYDRNRLNTMLSRYDAREAVIVIAIPDGNIINADSNQSIRGDMRVYIYRTDRSGPEFVDKVEVSSSGSQSVASLMDKAVQRTHSFLQKDWKNKTAIAPAQTQNIRVRVLYKDLSEWAETQNVLNRVAGIKETKIESLSPRSAFVTLFFDGTPDRLRLSLEQANLSLSDPKVDNQTLSGFGQSSRFGFRDRPPVIYDLRLTRFKNPVADNGRRLNERYSPEAGDRKHDIVEQENPAPISGSGGSRYRVPLSQGQ